MIIDLILDRQDGLKYDPKAFYLDIRGYEQSLEIEYISKAMDYGSNRDVQNALCKYIDDFDYDPEIKTYIRKVKWI